MRRMEKIRGGWPMFTAALLLSVGLFAVTGCSPHKEAAAPQAPPVKGPVELLTLGLEEVPVNREATGFVTSATDAVLSSQGAGTVESIRVKEGDRVRKGEILVELDRRELEARLSGARAEAENASVRYGRMKELYSTESVTRQELDNADRALKVARAAQAALEARLSDQTVRAPFDGIVTEKRIEAGEMAAPGRPLLRLVDDRRLRLDAAVPETEIQYLKPGDTVPVSLDALGGASVTGTVSRIDPSSDPSTHSFRVKVDLPQRPGLKTGLFGRMVYEAGTRKTVRVPASSIRVRGALSSVYVAEGDGVIRSRLVKTGPSAGDVVEILSGVSAGERIVVHADESLDGKRIEPSPGAP
jgi:RND family efflux transporter MFP subunit